MPFGLVALVVLPAEAARVPRSVGMNVLVVVADDLGVEHEAPTPTIDELADFGVTFEQAWANPTCSPTRASLHTGLLASAHGVGEPHPLGDPLLGTFGTYLEEAPSSYKTALFGKWHLGGDEDDPADLTLPADQGYDTFVGTFAGDVDYTGWVADVDGAATGTTPTTYYPTTFTVDQAYDYIAANKASPWTVTVSFHAPHEAADHMGYHDPTDFPEAASCAGLVVDADGDGVESDREKYWAMISCMDAELGRLLDDLAALGELTDTVVVYLGDNGTPSDVLVDSPTLDGWKGTTLEGGIRVPLLIADGRGYARNACPTTASKAGQVLHCGRTESTLVQVQDVTATIAEIMAAGGTSDDDFQAAIDGVSLVPWLNDTATTTNEREYVVSEKFSSTQLEVAVLRQDGYKLIWRSADGGATATCSLYLIPEEQASVG